MATTFTNAARSWVAGKIAPAALLPSPESKQEVLLDPGAYADPLVADNIGWIDTGQNPYGNQNFTDLQPLNRVDSVRRARIYFNLDPMARQAVRLHTSYAIGRGMSIKARIESGQSEEDPAAKALQEAADQFWEHADNSYVFSFEAQQENSNKYLVDGELFFLLFPPGLNEEDAADNGDQDDVTRVRVVDDPLQMIAIITNPEDNSEPWYYLRQWNVNNITKRYLYPDYRLFLRDERDRYDNLVLPPVPQVGYDLGNYEIQKNIFVRHAKMNTLGMRGVSMLVTFLDWAKVNRNYLEDRATVSKAFARFAWKRVVKGPASAVAAFGRRAASVVGFGAPPAPGSVGRGVIPPAPAGATVTTNPGLDWEAMQTPEGGKNAYTESRNFRLMIYAGSGFGEHYYGDGSMGTRATSKSMERPVELLLTDYQTSWKQIYTSLFAFDHKARGNTFDAHAVWVDAPQILEDDTVAVIMSYVSLIGVLPGLGVDEVVIRLLNALGIDSPQDVLPKIRAREKEQYEFNLMKAALTAGLDFNAQVDPNDPTAMQGQIKALQTFITFITDPTLMTQMPGPKTGPQFGPMQPGATLRTRVPAPPGLKPGSEEADFTWNESASLRQLLVRHVLEQWGLDPDNG